MPHYDIIVAGVGSMGAATCYHLARRGHRVLGIDQFAVPHDRGSHHGSTRMIRQAYFEDPAYVPLLRRAYQLWRDLEAESGEKVLHITGGLYIGSPGGAIVPGSLAAAKLHGLPYELLDADSLRQRFPQFRLPADHVGFHEPDAGFLIPELAVATHANLARKHGVTILENQPVLSHSTSATGVTVTTPAGTHHADHLVVTAGAWASRLLAGTGIPLTTTRQLLAWFETNKPTFDLGSGFPCWFIETATPYGHYGFPVVPGTGGGLKLAQHKPGTPIAPDDLKSPGQAPQPAETDSLHTVLQDYIPDAAGPLLDARTCLYTNSPDGHFVIGAHPAIPNTTIATGFSGHGFKFASVVGESLADLATHQPAPLLPKKLFSPTRFPTT